MTLTRYTAWPQLGQMLQEIERSLNAGAGNGEDGSNVATCDWIPAVDIREEAERFVIHADIPGVDPKDIEVTMERGVLTIKGERRFESTEERQAYKRVERARGSFYRRFGLPDSADAEGISARGVNGVLEIVIPKQQRTQPRRISVDS